MLCAFNESQVVAFHNGTRKMLSLKDKLVSVDITKLMDDDEFVTIEIDGKEYKIDKDNFIAIEPENLDDIVAMTSLAYEINKHEKILFVDRSNLSNKGTYLFEKDLYPVKFPESKKRRIMYHLAYKIATGTNIGIYVYDDIPFLPYGSKKALERRTRGRKNKVIAKCSSVIEALSCVKREKHVPINLNVE